MASVSWQSIVAEKKASIENSIPNDWKIKNAPSEDNLMDFPERCGILSPFDLEVTSLSATELVGRLATGNLKAVDLTLSFCKRAAVAQQLLNCVHLFFPEAALVQARQLDEYYARHNKTVGPLHGLPISLKDQLRVKGTETSMGYVAWVGKRDETDSVLVKLLRQAGAIFYVKTSVPQTLMVCETVNNIIGRTVNPRNKNWSCGGSSGGEGAMVGIRGSVMGVGTDIGGSIRIPAAFNSLFGIRPSHGRLPYAGMANSMEGQETVHSVVGPIAHSIPDLKLFIKSVLEEEPWKFDSKVIPLPWRQNEEEVIKSKITHGGLNIATYHHDSVVLPHPPILRGIDIVRSTLEKNGHNVFSWAPHEHELGVKLINKIYAADGCTDVYKNINASGEPAIPNIKDLLNPDLPKADVNEIWDVQLQKWHYQCAYLDKWRELEEKMGREIDAIIGPISPTAAIRHDQFRYYGYASIFNLLDFSSVVIPVTFADKEKDLKNSNFQPMGKIDAEVQAEYDPEAYHGAPVAVQVVGRRLSEERVLAIAEEISRLL
ncbi:acetamidase [Penicillium coprophilum]|uniref:acetamidase n=1 Tax=Penicillium coprophilum TaxID=36646 RepID=UPI002389DB75|nr:acetamidase [Penicillium coprophilum]KAJ5174080.1 acetamidase [Penicillium coprophilum]